MEKSFYRSLGLDLALDSYKSRSNGRAVKIPIFIDMYEREKHALRVFDLNWLRALIRIGAISLFRIECVE